MNTSFRRRCSTRRVRNRDRNRNHHRGRSVWDRRGCEFCLGGWWRVSCRETCGIGARRACESATETAKETWKGWSPGSENRREGKRSWGLGLRRQRRRRFEGWEGCWRCRGKSKRRRLGRNCGSPKRKELLPWKRKWFRRRSSPKRRYHRDFLSLLPFLFLTHSVCPTLIYIYIYTLPHLPRNHSTYDTVFWTF